MVENEERNRHSSIVSFSAPADNDQSIIYTYTARQWGSGQAEAYLDFLNEIMQQLADEPERAAFAPQRRKIRVYVARWKDARDGHRIFFRETDKGIYILRVLHTSMKWQNYIV